MMSIRGATRMLSVVPMVQWSRTVGSIVTFLSGFWLGHRGRPMLTVGKGGRRKKNKKHEKQKKRMTKAGYGERKK